MINKGKRWLVVPAMLLFSALLPEYLAFAPFLAATAVYIRDAKISELRQDIKGIGRPFIFYIIWMAAGLIYSKNPLQGSAFLIMWIGFFWCYVYAARFIDNGEKLDKALMGGAVCGGIAGGVGIVQIVLFHFGKYIYPPLKDMFNPFWRPLNGLIAKLVQSPACPGFLFNILPRHEFVAIKARASSTFSNPLMFACVIIILMPFAAYGMFYFKTKKERVLSFFCFLLMLGGVASSYSRGPYVAAVITMGVLLFYGGKKTLVILGISGCSFAAMAIASPGVFKRLMTILNTTDVSISLREIIYKTAYSVFREHWLFGLGTSNKNFRDVLLASTGVNQPHAHNLFYEIAVENGVIGLALFFAPVVLFIVCMLKMYFNKTSRNIAVTFGASLIGLLTCGLTDYVFYGLKTLIYFMLLFGLAEAAGRIYIVNSSSKSTPQRKEEN